MMFAARRIVKAAAARSGEMNATYDSSSGTGDISGWAAMSVMMEAQRQQDEQQLQVGQRLHDARRLQNSPPRPHAPHGDQPPPPYSVAPQRGHAQDQIYAQPQSSSTSPRQGQEQLMSYGNAALPCRRMGLDAKFCFNQRVTLLIEEHLTLATPEFTVVTTQGIHVPGQTDPAFTLESHKLTMSAAKFRLCTTSADAVIKGRFVLGQESTSSFDVKFDNTADDRHEGVRLESRGGFGSGHGEFEIMAKTLEVGSKRDKQDVLVARGRTLEPGCEIDVEAGMDVGLVVALVVCMNERRG